MGDEAEADLARIEQGGVARDHAGFLEPLQPSQARRGRQRDPLREVDVADAPVFLQQRQHAAVGAVQLGESVASLGSIMRESDDMTKYNA